MEGLSPLKGSKSAPKALQLRVNIQLSKPEGVDPSILSDEVRDLFNGEQTMASKAFTFNVPLDSKLTPESLRGIVYDFLAEKQKEIIAEHATA
jgi:hypothetical protein